MTDNNTKALVEIESTKSECNFCHQKEKRNVTIIYLPPEKRIHEERITEALSLCHKCIATVVLDAFENKVMSRMKE